MLNNIMVISKERASLMGVQTIHLSDIIIIVDDKNGVFWYSKNRYFPSTNDIDYPISDFDAHMRIISAIQKR